ncbi:MAG: exo-beta-N-acetylmuramidase NamZ family protein [Kiritimatiellia bacterium]
MHNQEELQPGIWELLERHFDWLAGQRIGLLSHPAAIDSSGESSVDLLWSALGPRLTALFGPEHGFFGSAGAGENVSTFRHPHWKIPIFSLYGRTKAPTAAMLRRIDVLVVDLQTLPVRCYTYISTLRYVLEAAARFGKCVVVADRPVPLANVVDGPPLDVKLTSFISLVDTPLCYGMTPAEIAGYLRTTLGLDLELKIARMRGYYRQPWRGPRWPPWVPPSPGIRSWESALCYPATVFAEALPALVYGRGETLPFQYLGIAGMSVPRLAEMANAMRLPGIQFHPHWFFSLTGAKQSLQEGIRLTVTDPDLFQPVRTAVTLLYLLLQHSGKKHLWPTELGRLDFFDRLFGSRAIRRQLLQGTSPDEICSEWDEALTSFRLARKRHLLYKEKTDNSRS